MLNIRMIIFSLIFISKYKKLKKVDLDSDCKHNADLDPQDLIYLLPFKASILLGSQGVDLPALSTKVDSIQHTDIIQQVNR